MNIRARGDDFRNMGRFLFHFLHSLTNRMNKNSSKNFLATRMPKKFKKYAGKIFLEFGFPTFFQYYWQMRCIFEKTKLIHQMVYLFSHYFLTFQGAENSRPLLILYDRNMSSPFDADPSRGDMWRQRNPAPKGQE